MHSCRGPRPWSLRGPTGISPDSPTPVMMTSPVSRGSVSRTTTVPWARGSVTTTGIASTRRRPVPWWTMWRVMPWRTMSGRRGTPRRRVMSGIREITWRMMSWWTMTPWWTVSWGSSSRWAISSGRGSCSWT